MYEDYEDFLTMDWVNELDKKDLIVMGMYLSGYPVRLIASKLGVKPQAVYRRLKTERVQKGMEMIKREVTRNLILSLSGVVTSAVNVVKNSYDKISKSDFLCRDYFEDIKRVLDLLLEWDFSGAYK
jgi:hypothetical protein